VRGRPVITRKQLDLPPAVARAFFANVRAYFAEDDGYKRNAIAVLGAPFTLPSNFLLIPCRGR
jgi:hypothetical protein